MKNNKLLLLIVCLLTLFACKETKVNRMVSVSILPQKYFIERIAGNFLQINVMIPPGMNPATSDLNMRQLKNLYDSKICFTIGNLPFEEAHLFPALQGRDSIQIVKHIESIPLLESACHEHEHDHEGDPHIWMSPKNAITICREITNVLSQEYPEQSETFNANCAVLIHEIDSIANRAAKVLAPKKQRSFLIYHPALTYFAHDYDLNQISIEHEGKEPSSSHMQHIIDKAKAENIRIVFIQTQFESSNAEAIAKAINGLVIPINPLTDNWNNEVCDLINILNDNLN